MKKRILVACIVAVCMSLLSSVPVRTEPQGAQGAAAHRATLDQYCVTCHDNDGRMANLSLENLDLANLSGQEELWEKVVRKLRAGVMPPPGQPRPAWADYVALTEFLETNIDRRASVNPGTKVMHRLNRTEYANAVRDLLDLEIDASTLLPPDTSARGFDNMAGSLTISPTLLDAYVTAATTIAGMAIGFPKLPSEMIYLAPGDTSQTQQIETLPFGTRGGMLVRHIFPADGEYRFFIQNHRLGNFFPAEQLELSIDGERVHLWRYQGVGLGRVEGGEGALEVSVPVKAGSRMVGATFLATNYRPGLDLIRQYDRTSLENEAIPQLQYPPAIGLFRIQGPFGAQRPLDSPSVRKVFTCRPANISEEATCAQEILSTLARRAYRRPVTPTDLEALIEFYQDGRQSGDFEDGIELAVARILASPQFLVRTEHQPANLAPGQTYRIADLELASRLSFFLWSSIPDDELIDLAGKGRLSDPAVLEQQVRRMLADSKADALVTNFAQQWLYLRNLPGTSPDGVFYPDWDDELRLSFKRETELFFESIMREDRNVLDLLTADYTFVNERIARHYGIPHVFGPLFRRVTLGPDLDYRRGLLGKGSFLTVTFTQNFRTSPVKRGVWVLENILGTPPPEPPPNVPPLEDTEVGTEEVFTLRKQMEQHQRNEPCAGCHKLMDPIGFALENFDGDGKWRTIEGHPQREGGLSTSIDAATVLYDGTRVNGVTGLREALLRYSPQFVRFVTEKLMTYGVGRGVEYFDMPAVRAIVRDAQKDDYRFSSIVLGVVRSAPFQMRTASKE